MRKSFDKLISWTGVIMAVVLVVAGGLLLWASSFIAGNVHDQLAAQKITMPAAAALTTQEMKDALGEYSGQQMTTGAQAKAYADHYILVHMNESSGGRAYSEVSSEYMKAANDPTADPEQVAKLGDLRQTLFMGSTLRGLLLYGYAFATMGQIAQIAAIASFIGAGILLVLSLAGFRHAKAARDEEAAATTGAAPEPVSAT
jgi:hypothetical protein